MHEIQMLGLLEHDVLSSIEVPFLPDCGNPYATPQRDTFSSDDHPPSKVEADKTDMDTFVLTKVSRPPNLNRNSFASSSAGSGTIVGSSSYHSTIDKRTMLTHRNSIMSTRIAPIEESPRRIITELLPEETGQPSRPVSILHRTPKATVATLSTSPSESSVRSVQSNQSVSTATSSSKGERRRDTTSSSRASLTSKLTPSWLFNPFRSGISEPQTTPVSASAISSNPNAPRATSPARPIRLPVPPKATTGQISPLSRSPLPMNIRGKATVSSRSTLSRTFEEETAVPHRGLYSRPANSPVGTPPREDVNFSKRHSALSTLSIPVASSSPTGPNWSSRSNPSRPQASISYTQASLARRWQHMYAQPSYKHEIKWRSMVTPGCLPLTVEHFPTAAELDSSYDVFSYDFVIDPPEMRSFLVKPPIVPMASRHDKDEVRRGWALRVMRGMVAVRLIQGFQFVLRPNKEGVGDVEEERGFLRRSKSYIGIEDDMMPTATGAGEILRSTSHPVYLSMSNEIHHISYTGEAIQVKRYVRRMPSMHPFKYQCLIWPKLGVGYTELATEFTTHGLENYGWNR